MAELCDLERGKIVLRQCRDQAGHDAGLANISRLPADDDDCHKHWLTGDDLYQGEPSGMAFSEQI